MPKNRRHYRITLNDVLEAHRKALQFGGREGIVNMASIESALGRPYTGYYRTIHKKAAAIIQSFVKNHGFVDGNKRTALALLLLFLERSGYRLAQEPAPLRNQEIEQMILDVCESRMEFPELEIWFKERIESLP